MCFSKGKCCLPPGGSPFLSSGSYARRVSAGSWMWVHLISTRTISSTRIFVVFVLQFLVCSGSAASHTTAAMRRRCVPSCLLLSSRASAPWLLLRPSPPGARCPAAGLHLCERAFPKSLLASPAVATSRAAGRCCESLRRKFLLVAPLPRAHLMEKVVAVDMLHMWAVGRGGCFPRCKGLAALLPAGEMVATSAGQPCCQR
jgi:hypothetical protein